MNVLDEIRRCQEMVAQVIGPAVRMAHEMTRQLREVQEIYKYPVWPAARMAQDMVRTVELVEKRHRKFVALLQKLRWPPPGHLSCRIIDRLADAYSTGQLADAEVEALLVKAYSPSIIAGIERKWASYPWLAGRMTILHEALANYPDGRYHSVVCALMPQLEGLFGSELGRKPRPKDDAPAVFRDSAYSTLFSDYYVQVIFKSFNPWNPTLPVPDLSRHAILHGRATDYGTKVHALKLIIVTDYLLKSLDARRNGAR